MTGGPIEVSLSKSRDLRLPGIEYNRDGLQTDPRTLFVPQFQLLAVGADTFGTWADGEWENYAPPGGPYAARITIGPGNPGPVNPGVAGTYRLWVMYFQTGASGIETPAGPCGVVKLAAP